MFVLTRPENGWVAMDPSLNSHWSPVEEDLLMNGHKIGFICGGIDDLYNGGYLSASGKWIRTGTIGDYHAAKKYVEAMSGYRRPPASTSPTGKHK